MIKRTLMLTMPAVLLVVGCGQRQGSRAAPDPSAQHASVRGTATDSDARDSTRIAPMPAATSTVAVRIQDAGADSSDASMPRVTSEVGRSSSNARERVVNHAAGELPAHPLRNCVTNATRAERHSHRIRAALPDGGLARVELDRSETNSCWANSECNIHRGETPGSTDGQVSISCVGEHCKCSATTYVPAEVHNYSFIATNPCRDIKTLLRERCGG
jgi:hypothetical protein